MCVHRYDNIELKKYEFCITKYELEIINVGLQCI